MTEEEQMLKKLVDFTDEISNKLEEIKDDNKIKKSKFEEMLNEYNLEYEEIKEDGMTYYKNDTYIVGFNIDNIDEEYYRISGLGASFI